MNIDSTLKQLKFYLLLGLIPFLNLENVFAQGLGIEINPPVSILHTYDNNANTGTDAGITIEQDGTGDAAAQFFITGIRRWVMGIDQSDANKFKIASSTDLNSDAHFTIDVNGQIGIGTTAPTYHLDLRENAANASAMRLQNSDATGYSAIDVYDNGGFIMGSIGYGNTSVTNAALDDRVYLWGFGKDVVLSDGTDVNLIAKTSGNIGIGTTNPSTLLHVSSETAGDATLTVSADTDNNDEADNVLINMLQDGGTTIGFIGLEGDAGVTYTNSLQNATVTGSTNDAFQIMTNGAARMTVENGGQIGVGTNAPSVSFHINATDALLLPVGTTAQRPGGAASGMFRYNSTTNLLEYYDGGGALWRPLSTTTALQDGDGDTKIDVEETADEDDIRFDTDGSERMVIQDNGDVEFYSTNGMYARFDESLERFELIAAGGCCDDAFELNNQNIDEVNRITINDPGDNEGLLWNGTAAEIVVTELNGGTNDGYLRLINDGGITFEAGAEDTEDMIILPTGEVGIGLEVPLHRLHISDDINNGYTELRLENTNAQDGVQIGFDEPGGQDPDFLIRYNSEAAGTDNHLQFLGDDKTNPAFMIDRNTNSAGVNLVGGDDPEQEFDVNGDIRLSGDGGDIEFDDADKRIRENGADLEMRNLDGDLLLTTDGGAGDDIDLDAEDDIRFYSDGTEIVRFDGGNDRVGIGVTGPREELEVAGAILIGDAVNMNNGTIRYDGADIEGRVGGAWVSLTGGGGGGDFSNNGDNAGANRDIGNNDNFDLGIETNGTDRILIDNGGDVTINPGGNNDDFIVESNNQANMLFVDGGNDRVGIRTNAPGQEFDVNGDIRLSANNSDLEFDGADKRIRENDGDLEIENTTEDITITTDGGGDDIDIDAEDDIKFYSDGTEFVHMDGGNDYVGIGDLAPSRRIELPNTGNNAGRGRANAWQTYSSEAWKTDIQTINSAMDKIKQMRGVSFTWKPEYGGTKDIGVIAEEVALVFPEIVDMYDNDPETIGLDYSRLVSVLIEGMKEQQEEIEQLKAQMAAIIELLSLQSKLKDIKPDYTVNKSESPLVKSGKSIQDIRGTLNKGFTQVDDADNTSDND